MTDWKTLRHILAAGAVRMIAGKEAWDLFNTPARRRPTLNLSSQDNDLDYGNQDDIVSGVRHMGRTFGIVRKILRTYANHVVGSCEANWTTGNEAWDTLAEERWKENMRTLDISGRFHFRTLARLAIISTARDGDIGVAKNRINGLRQIGLIEKDRIRNTSQASDFNTPGTNWIEGVHVGPSSRLDAFRVWDRSDMPGGGFENARNISARDMFLLSDPDRVDGVRGVSWFANGGLNNLIDRKDILESEKHAVKANNRIAMIITKALGGVETAGLNIWGQKNTEDNPGPNIYGEEIPSGTIKYLQQGEDVKSHMSNRPSATFQGFDEALIRDIAIGLELPFGMVWSMAGMSGPGVRFDISQAARVFAEKFALMDFQLIRPIIQWTIAGDMEDGILPFNPNWTKFDIQAPPSATIDLGRESAADLAEHDRGVCSLTDLAAKRGKNAFSTLEMKAREAQHALALADRFEVPIGMIMNVKSAGAGPGAPTAIAADPKKKGPKKVEKKDDQDEDDDQAPAKKATPPPKKAAKKDGDTDDQAPAGADDKTKDMKTILDSYGVGVRAGIFTPSIDDENHFRALAGLPPITEAARQAWTKDQGSRRPVTLTPPPGGTPAPGAATANEDQEDE